MLSSLGFDSKVARNTRNNSKYVLEVPRGFSVHVFKSPSPPLPTQNTAVKPDYSSVRTPSSTPWKPTPYTARQDTDKKLSFGSSDGTRRDQVTDYDQVALTRTKSNKPYGIVPGAIPDTYIYERSISSASDLPGSPSSSSSSDSDTIDGISPFSLEVSSTRASSSTETLDATSYYAHNQDASTTSVTSPYGNTRGPVIPPSGRQAMANLTNTHSSRYVSADHEDDPTVIFGEYGAARAVGQSSQAGGNTMPPAHTGRRNSEERSGRTTVPVFPSAPPLTRRESRSRSTSPTANATEGDGGLRLPPGLQYVTPSIYPNGPVGTLQRANSSPTVSLTQRAPQDATKPPLTRGMSNPETIAAKRCVRWTEDLICPSLPPDQRRKGWFNRRGDQLWTNDGKYRSPEPGQEYPPDLANYPDPSEGWMNEECVRIDLLHRLIPKPPLRSALKRAKYPAHPIPEEMSTG
ncbi:hypothetical protein BC835DRAFT_1419725 [Cytidiella melzeri]|nr:hypothetical protein BC835DRAFT_1419725 [Cytidiella melzeri]